MRVAVLLGEVGPSATVYSGDAYGGLLEIH